MGLLLASCVTVKDVYLPSGEKAHAIDCSGAVMTREMCQEKAGELCKDKGYEILSYTEEEQTTLIVGLPGPKIRTLKVQCKL